MKTTPSHPVGSRVPVPSESPRPVHSPRSAVDAAAATPPVGALAQPTIELPRDARAGEVSFLGHYHVHLAWCALNEGRTARVNLRATSGQQEVLLTPEQPRQRVTLDPVTGAVELHADQGPTALLHADLQVDPAAVFNGLVARWPLPGGDPIVFEPPGNAGVRIDNAGRDIFPFLSLATAPERQGQGQFIPLSSAPRTPFARALAQAAAEPGHPALASARVAASFLASTEALRSQEQLGEPIARLPALYQHLMTLADTQPLAALRDLVEQQLGPEAASLLDNTEDDPPVRTVRARLEDNLLARLWSPLPSAIGHDLVSSLRVLSFLDRLAAGDSTIETPLGRRTVLGARLLVPDWATPALAEASSPPGAGWVRLAGIGELNVLRQAPIGYRLGEVAYTVNLMPHERRRWMARSRTGSLEAALTDEQQRDWSHTAQADDTHSDLRRELDELLGQERASRNYDNLEVDFPEDGLDETVSGTIDRERCRERRGVRQATQSVQTLTRLAASRIERRVASRRQRWLLEEQERRMQVDIDNRTANTAEVGLYYWLDRVYRLWVVGRGERLILEVLLPAPAAELIARLVAQAPALVEPVPLAEQSPPVYGPQDITADNWQLLAIEYGAAGAHPPPIETLVLQGRVGTGVPIEEAELIVPPGFSAETGSVTYVIADQRAGLAGFIGDWAFAVAGVEPPDPAAPSASPPECSEMRSPSAPPIPTSGSLTLPVSSLPALTAGRYFISAATSATSFAALVLLTCQRQEPTSATTAWQMETYAALVDAYNTKLVAYRAALGERIRRASAGGMRRIEQEALLQGTMPLLYALHTDADADEPTYLRFFDRALDGAEMAYRFYPFAAGSEPPPGARWAGEVLVHPNSDALFCSFLAASSARVLLPIRPAEELAMLYYLAFGRLPPWEAADVPVAAIHARTLGQLLASRETAAGRDEQHWEEAVPTSLVVLESDAALLDRLTPSAHPRSRGTL